MSALTQQYNLRTISLLPEILATTGEPHDNPIYQKFDNFIEKLSSGDNGGHDALIEVSLDGTSYNVNLTDLIDYIAQYVVQQTGLYVTVNNDLVVHGKKYFTNKDLTDNDVTYTSQITIDSLSNDSDLTALSVCNGNIITHSNINMLSASSTERATNINIGKNVILNVDEHINGLALSANWA